MRSDKDAIIVEVVKYSKSTGKTELMSKDGALLIYNQKLKKVSQN